MSIPRLFHAATLLSNGKVFVVGGFIFVGASPVATASAELYDPSPGTFSTTSSFGTAQSGLAAVVLSDGNVLVRSLSTAEVYNPTTGSFANTGAPSANEIENAPVVLNNGTVLDAGGNFTNPAVQIYYSNAPLAPLTITTTSLPNGIVNQAYTRVLLQQGGGGSLTWT